MSEHRRRHINDYVYDAAQEAAAKLGEIPTWVVTVIVNAAMDAENGCVADSCGDPVNYAGAYRLGDRKIILGFCERHFDESDGDRLVVDR